ncbi:MAG TPA: MerR family DNA-binding protein [Burkholderiales bacterium]|nr:MerR family DNA-binding protein [Burkholderiales bacterium]
MDTAAENFTIGKLAARCGMSVQAIRYYERRGLLPTPARAASGYRLYSEPVARRLHFIHRAQALGFSLEEVKELLALSVRPGTTCADIRRRASDKIDSIDRKVTDLRRIRDVLAKLATSCRAQGPTSECPILEALDGGPSQDER